ncbi:hypothetical protein BH09PSE4_BH09PSE4_20300 [soil metagenome]
MKPLLISDCDEVLLHMVRHFGDWLGEHHDIDLVPDGGEFSTLMQRRNGGTPPTREESWDYVNGFFPAEMHRQTLVPHAADALAALAERADIVILNNLAEECRVPRIEQLAAFGIAHRVQCNSGGKGGPVARLAEEHGSSVTVFVDDLSHHHESVARHAPGVWRLHMVSEPSLAPHVPPSPSAHARIDDWREAQAWIDARFAEGRPAI